MAASSNRSMFGFLEETDGLKNNGPVETPFGLVSDKLWELFQVINYAVVGQIINVFGTVANIINITVFIKQGFRDPVNVSLFSLAISDLGCLVTLIWHNICWNPLFRRADLPFDALEVQYLTAGWPHVVFTRVTGWITACITLERCLCITMPLKVKTIITPKRVAVVMAAVFIVLIVSVSPLYYANRLAWKFYPEKNKTLLGLTFTDNREQIESVSFSLNNVVIPFTAFITVTTGTVVLVAKLRRKTEWRKTKTSKGQSDSATIRDQRVARIIVMISSLFIVCFLPLSVFFIVIIVEPEMSIDGIYDTTFHTIFSFSYLLESISSSGNIFIYYHMSSKYKATFNQLFCLAKR